MENRVNSWIIFRDRVIKAIVVSCLVCITQNAKPDKVYWCRKTQGCPESNSSPLHFILLSKKAQTQHVGLSWLPSASPSLLHLLLLFFSFSLPSVSPLLFFLLLFLYPTSPNHFRHVLECYLYIRFLCFKSELLTSRWATCRISVKQILRKFPVLCFVS